MYLCLVEIQQFTLKLKLNGKIPQIPNISHYFLYNHVFTGNKELFITRIHIELYGNYYILCGNYRFFMYFFT